MSERESEIIWVGNNQAGHFEVDGREVEVPDDAELSEMRERLVGRSIIWVGGDEREGYELRLDDGQLVEFSGIWCNDSTADVSCRFWSDGGQDVATEESEQS